MIWVLWFGGLLLVFAVVEGFALATGRISTLSRTVWRLTVRYPIIPFLLGLACGGLAVHFFGLIPPCAP